MSFRCVRQATSVAPTPSFGAFATSPGAPAPLSTIYYALLFGFRLLGGHLLLHRNKPPPDYPPYVTEQKFPFSQVARVRNYIMRVLRGRLVSMGQEVATKKKNREQVIVANGGKPGRRDIARRKGGKGAGRGNRWRDLRTGIPETQQQSQIDTFSFRL